MILGGVGLLILIAMAGVAILNALFFPRLESDAPRREGVSGGQVASAAGGASVSVLIPARNEARVLDDTLAGLHAQDDQRLLEILVLDDQSSDATPEIVRQWSRQDARVNLVEGQPLPPGWTGKNWACMQLAQRAVGDVLVFTDADVHWQPGALRALLDTMQRYHAEMFTAWPTQTTQTWGERLVVPMMMFVLLAYLPEPGVRLLPFASLSAANGQCLALRRPAYDLLGGHAAVANQVVEDVALARLAKRQGLRLVMALGNHLIEGRMYHNWPEARDGFAKNILAGHGNWPPALALSGLFHTLLFAWPWVWLFLAPPGQRAMPLAWIALGVLVRALTAAVSGARLRDALLLPVSVLLFWLIAARSLIWHTRRGGPQWKGRWINTPLS